MSIILIGFKASGKSSVAKELALKLKQKFLDIDNLIEELYLQKYQKTCSCYEIFFKHQEPFFRSLEKEAILNIKNKKGVIATGGGSIIDPDNVNILKKMGLLVFLQGSFKVIKKRLDGKENIFTNMKSDLLSLFQIRESIYQQIADIIINIDNKNVLSIVNEILGKINGK